MSGKENGDSAKAPLGTANRRRFMGAAGALTGASIASIVVSDTAAAERSEERDAIRAPRITAHRGYADVYPENTVAAVAGSSRLRADRIEIDVVACEDGEIVVFHDNVLDHLTDESGPVAETPFETVTQTEVLESGETIPTLGEVLDAARPSITMNIEFKASGNDSWLEFADRALGIAAEYPGDFYVSSFESDALEAVREIDPTIPVGVIFGSNPEENLEIARELDAEAVNVSTGVLDRALVETAHAEGREVNVWTIDSWRDATAPLELGVDGLIADYPSVRDFGTGKRAPSAPGQ
ncbi:glycerophosphodiester phosphodiesterase [Halosolutus gelatinilyticus]|uniref:glycerophosphodiester phosphodiesterase n=1 Tax=Halosolutus gelatinilyticus TaxID=2931975 RepID=UPI001FF542EB|nr:glycerophosphodiester phosphodiesterase [Halosolutus gelatinilyticus]